MEAPLKDCTTLEQRAVIRFLNAEGIQTSQICQRMKNIYEGERSRADVTSLGAKALLIRTRWEPSHY
ncbi:hypothetical protein LAZ67_3004613 [Cordylochernes scorpioides]|uniref:Mos1 transposase HTH domain-containing protein n=1 Tax=Cordylochernes scorpioides TaxID=51811 RepID=A0ABY6KCE9_9ARAC|nr:hypothetical protein LAZ67_3004613 [Cordylochernes scorpioides]